MADTSGSLSEEDAASSGVAPLEDIEHDLNTVDKALAALDSDDVEEAEALAAELDSPRAERSDGDEHRGSERGPASGSAC